MGLPPIWSIMSKEESLDRAAAIVASWPEWKKGVLEASFKSTNEQPRPVVVEGLADYD